MYGHGHPYPPPPPPRPSGLSPLAIVLIVVGAVFVLGAGACVVLGGLIALGASAEEASSDPAATPTSTSGSKQAAPNATATATATSTGEPTDEDEPPSPPTPTAAATATATATGAATNAGGTKWMCNATGWVRVCGFANVCNNQMVSGLGVGNDRYMAMTMAKNACENMARAKGGATVCTVACSPSAK